MTVTQKLMSPGRWNLTLSPDAVPGDVWDTLDPDVNGFGHIVILPGPLDPDAVGDAAMLSAARYVGVYLGTTSRNQLFGEGLETWLGDADGKGNIWETNKTGTSGTYTDQSFRAWIDDLLPVSITEGTLTDISGTYTATLRFLNPRQGLERVMDYFGGEWKVQNDGTLDAGTESDLFVTDPTAAIVWSGSGYEPDLRGLSGSVDVARDLEDYSTRVVVVGQGNNGDAVAVGSASLSPATSYKDLHGNTAVRKRLVSAPDAPSGSVGAFASTQLGRFDDTRNAYTLSTDDYDVRGIVEVGDYVWVYDPRPDVDLKDTSNEVYFGGKLINPVKIRVQSMTWPVHRGMGVYFRDKDGDYTNLTPYVEWEDSAPTLDVGASPRTLSTSVTPAERVQQQVLSTTKFGRQRTTGATAIGTSDTTVATVTLTIPAEWGTWRWWAVSTFQVDGGAGTSKRLVQVKVKRAGTTRHQIGVACPLDQTNVSISASGTGVSATGSQTFLVTCQLPSSDSFDAEQRILTVEATRTG